MKCEECKKNVIDVGFQEGSFVICKTCNDKAEAEWLEFHQAQSDLVDLFV
jgi:hypothetical protein